MDLFIQLDDDGNPINHPILAQNLQWVIADFDPNNPPTGYARFKRNWPPVVGPDHTYDVHYKFIGGVFQDVFDVRELTPQEKYQRDQEYHNMMLQGKPAPLPTPINLDQPTQIQSNNPTKSQTVETLINNQTEQPAQPQQLLTDNHQPEETQPILDQEPKTFPNIIVLINNIIVSFSEGIDLIPDNNSNEMLFYYTFSSNERVKLNSISQTSLERTDDLPVTYDGNKGDFYVIKSIGAVFAWSGTEWLQITDNTRDPSNNNKTDTSSTWEFNSNINFNLKVSSEIRQERIHICNNCENLSKIKTCSQCGCFMPLKTWLKSSKCPIDKWLEV